MLIETDFDDWQPSPVIRKAGRGYSRKAITEFRYEAASLTGRQAVFYRNLITIALTLGRRDIRSILKSQTGVADISIAAASRSPNMRDLFCPWRMTPAER